MTQSSTIAAAIQQVTSRPVELIVIDTIGDRTQADGIPLHSIGGQGVFVKEVQRAVLDGTADIAVHSAKDLPSEVADGLRLAAFTERRDPRDVLVGHALGDLELGATVATGSVRRRAQLAARRPDLRFAELRGNIETRLAKVPDGGSIVMAIAALQILELTGHVAEVLSLDEFVPAVGQGCVAVECRADDDATADVLRRIDHPPTRRAVEIERAYLAELGSGCSLPVAGHVDGATLSVFLADPDRAVSVSERVELSSSSDATDDWAADLELARHLASSVTDRLAAIGSDDVR